MRNILSSTLRFVKLGTGAIVLGLLLAMLLMAKSGAHEEHPVPVKAGEVYAMVAMCRAEGANEVAKANLLAGDFGVGNTRLDELVSEKPPRCFKWRTPVGLEVQGVVYVGTQANLHVYIVQFGTRAFAVMAILRSPTGAVDRSI